MTGTATLDVSSNEANGRLYWVISALATLPSAAQVKLGQDFSGSPAIKSGNQIVTAVGSQPDIFVTGLTPGTAVFAYFMQEDVAGNQSVVVSSTTFTPPAVPVLTSPTDNATGDTTATIGVVTDTNNGVLYTVITTSATPPTAAQVKTGLNNLGAPAVYSGNQIVTTVGAKTFTPASLTQLTSYFTYFMHENSLAGQSLVSAADGFTTASAPDIAPPVLTAPTSAATGPTSASIGVTTNEPSGTLYWVITQFGIAPTRAQVKAGQNHLGAAADRSSNQLVTVAGVQAIAAVTALATSTTYFAHFMHEDASTNQSNVATSSSFSLIPAAPVLTAPIDTTINDTTATLGVTTNTANGTLYTVVTTSGVPPTAAQVKAGQTNTGAAAAFAGNQAITTTGAKTFTATGLAQLTAYFAYFMHENATPTQSLVAAGNGFTTAATPDTTAPILTSPVGSATSSTSANLNVTTNEGNGTLYWVIAKTATAPTKAQVKAGQSNTGAPADKAGNKVVTAAGSQGPIPVTAIPTGFTYFVHFMHEDAAVNQSNVVSSASFVLVPAAPVLTAPIDTAATSTTATLGITTDTANGILYTVVTTSSTPPTAGQIKLGLTNTGTAAAFAGNQAVSTTGAKTFTATGLTPLTNYFTYFMQENSFSTQSLVSAADGFSTPATPDTTAPVLSSPTAVTTSTTTVTIDVSSNEANGRLYWVLAATSTAPSKAQVKLGQDSAGVAATKSGNQAVTATGSQPDILVTGLTPSSTYFAHFMHEDTATNQSTVVSTTAVTTNPLPTPRPVTLIWATPSFDNKPDFDVVFATSPVDGTEAQVGDVLRVQDQTAGGGWTSPADYVVHPLVSGDLTGATISVTAAALADGNYAFRARLERPLGGNSTWSADALVTVSTTVVTGGSKDVYLRAFTDKPGVVNPADGSLRSDADKLIFPPVGHGPTDGYLRAFTDKVGVVNATDGSLRAITDK